PGAVKAAPWLGAARRTLNGEDRSEMIAEEGKAVRKIGEKWSAILVPSPAASDSVAEVRGFAGRAAGCATMLRRVAGGFLDRPRVGTGTEGAFRNEGLLPGAQF